MLKKISFTFNIVLGVTGAGRLGFADVYPRDFETTRVHSASYVLVKPAREIFRGGVYFVEGWRLVQIRVVESGESLGGDLLDVSEVHEYPVRLKLRAGHNDLDDPVMPVQSAARAFVIPQAVCR